MIFDRHSKTALLIATATLTVSAISFHFAVAAANYYLQKHPVPLREPLTDISRRLGLWEAEGVDGRLTAEMEEDLGTKHYIDRWYARQGPDVVAGRIHVHLTYYTGLIDTVPHIPDRCLVASGAVLHTRPANHDLALDRNTWVLDPDRVNLRTGEPYWSYTYRDLVTAEPITVRMPFGEFRLRTSEYRMTKRPDIRIHAGYFFIANGQVTPFPDRVRRFAFDLTTRYAYYAKVQFTMYTVEDIGTEDFVETASDLLADLLPEVMRCLPDWAEVEAASEESNDAI